jgi:hypothetical protein
MDADEGIRAEDLSTDDLLRELSNLYRTRLDAIRHASRQALLTHTERMAEFEAEYLSRFPEREQDPDRTRTGARSDR